MKFEEQLKTVIDMCDNEDLPATGVIWKLNYDEMVSLLKSYKETQ